MTENKRFELYKMASTIKDNETNIDYDCGVVGVNSDIFNLCNLLNSLSEENEQLLKEKIDAETKLYKANEQLLMQMDYDNLCKENQNMEFELIKIKKENEQLKQHIKWILQNELNKSDIPVWRHQYVKSLAEKLGVEIE